MSGEHDMAPLVGRRQAAREAFDDTWSGGWNHEGWAERLQRAREEAIETATRVRITPEVVEAYYLAFYGKRPNVRYGSDIKRLAGLKAAFEAAGFEVEQ